MSRILIVAPNNPFPSDSGGRLRTYGFTRLLSRYFEIDFLTTKRADKRPPDLPSLRLFEIERTMSPRDCAVRSLLRFRNCSWFSHLDVDLGNQLTRLMEGQRYDFVLLENTMLGALIPLIRSVRPTQRIVVNAHNFETALAEQISRTQQGMARKGFFRFNSIATRRDERKVVRQADRILACSESDAEEFRAITDADGDGDKIRVIPNFIDAGSYPSSPMPSDRDARSIAFVGDMGYWPNVNGAKHFHSKILPIIRERMPGLIWYVVGRNCHPSVVEMVGADPNVVITGQVPRVSEYVSRCDATVVPLLEGSGTRLKILEAWAIGRPVVSTSVGCQGLACEDGRDILVADTPEAFAAGVVSLLTDREKAESITGEARSTLLAHYDIGSVERDLIDAVRFAA